MQQVDLTIPTLKGRFNAMIGTGGIGAGSLFLLNGNHTVGREESRSGNFLDARDYCKLHIISHYVKVLTGPDFQVFPIGKTGDDDWGRSILKEMESVGLEMGYVETSAGDKTLFSFCFIYPDGSGGNFTTENSACASIDQNFIENASEVFSKFKDTFVSLAAPEVPLPARKRLLEFSRQYGGFGVASFVTGEAKPAESSGMFELVDLFALNLEEAAAIIGIGTDQNAPVFIIEKTIEKLRTFNPSVCLSVTNGKQGSWSWDSKTLSFKPAFNVNTKSSAGAGDAHIAGIIAGISAGLPLEEAQTLGNLTAAYSVTSPHSIHPDLSKKELAKLAVKSGCGGRMLLSMLNE